MKILISDALSDKGKEVLSSAKGFEVDDRKGISADDLAQCIDQYDGLIVRSQTKVTEDLIKKADKLKVIGRAGVGVDNVDIEAATKNGIVVLNTPDVNTISTAEHTISMLLSLSRNIPQAVASLKAGKWERGKFVGTEVQGKTLGVIGMGRIGAEVVQRAQAFQMRVLAFDPFMSPERATKLKVEIAEIDRIFKESDYITVHTPLTSETRGLVNKEAFAKMKDGVRIVNCARGGIVDEADLEEALKSGKVAGAALDVYNEEPPKRTSLLELDNVICTPHLGASTKEAQLNVAIDVANSVVDALQGKTIRNAVNMATLDSDTLKQIQPYLFLAEKLGSLIAQLLEGTVEKVCLNYSGKISEVNTDPVTVAILKGLLGHVLQMNVNLVNAHLIAKERGIKVMEQKTSDVEEFSDLLTIEIKTTTKTFTVAGTLLGKKNEPRIVKINENFVDAVPSGFLLIVTNVDRPGIIGSLGTVLGEGDVNIAGMTVGRQEVGQHAVTVVNVDSIVPEEVLKKITALPDIVNCKMVEL